MKHAQFPFLLGMPTSLCRVMSDTQYYNWAEPGAGGTTPREIEEGELSDGVPSSDEDLSPRSLVIDAQEHGEGEGAGLGIW